MNPLSIELYKRYKLDITREPLEFAMNNQHMNGGLSVNVWGQTSLEGCYAVGEAAGTHGVTRPGGAALNAGQVFGTRCAEHIASRAPEPGIGADVADILDRALDEIAGTLRVGSGLNVSKLRDEIQGRMSDRAGMICNAPDVGAALAAARALNASIAAEGVGYDGAYEALRALQWRQMAMVSEAVLTALNVYIERGGGSRGARVICDPDGECAPKPVQARSKAIDFAGNATATGASRFA